MKFKTALAMARAFYMSPITLFILFDMAWYCVQNGLPFVITETFTTEEEDKAVNRKHACHREGRAFDVSVIGWTKKQMDTFMKYFEEKWGHLGAIGSETGKRNLVELHSGTELHFHVQIEKLYAVKANLKEPLYVT